MLNPFKSLDLNALPTDVQAAVLAAHEQVSGIVEQNAALTETNATLTTIYGDFEYQAVSRGEPRRVVAKVEWHPGELFPRVGFVVTNLSMEPDWIIRSYNQGGKAEQHIKEGNPVQQW